MAAPVDHGSTLGDAAGAGDSEPAPEHQSSQDPYPSPFDPLAGVQASDLPSPPSAPGGGLEGEGNAGAPLLPPLPVAPASPPSPSGEPRKKGHPRRISGSTRAKPRLLASAPTLSTRPAPAFDTDWLWQSA